MYDVDLKNNQKAFKMNPNKCNRKKISFLSFVCVASLFIAKLYNTQRKCISVSLCFHIHFARKAIKMNQAPIFYHFLFRTLRFQLRGVSVSFQPILLS